MYKLDHIYNLNLQLSIIFIWANNFCLRQIVVKEHYV